MECQRISCPETDKREEIELERTPCGIVISGCSRFQPGSAVECTRACAVRLDRSDRRGVDDIAPRVLVVYTSRDAQTKAIALALADHLSRDGLTAELADADAGAVPPPADYETVVIGSALRFGRQARSVIEYIGHHGDALAAMPAFFFSVGNDDDIGLMCRATGWRPTGSAVFEAIAPADSHLVRDFAMTIGEEVPTPEWVTTMRPLPQRPIEEVRERSPRPTTG
ncbi:MAG: hypothetical protein H0T42_18995 [Deltaproteobacteria bacterium]|nr:hypothetical protein [Deltaproteobacteria bacterium]